jgi:hypothetical protein
MLMKRHRDPRMEVRHQLKSLRTSRVSKRKNLQLVHKP